MYRSLLKPGKGRDGAGTSHPVPATKIRDETFVTTRPHHARAGAGILFLDMSNIVLIVSLERQCSAMEEGSEGVLFVQPSLAITEFWEFQAGCEAISKRLHTLACKHGRFMGISIVGLN